MTQNHRFGLGLSCFTLGAVFGACATALFTPNSGKRTRRLLLRKAEDAQDRATDTGRMIADKGRELYERGAKFAVNAGGH